MKLKARTQNILLGSIILLSAGVLRFYKIDSIPYTHDEFSALFRLYFPSFLELIRFGVAPDGHPVGVQAFLYFYTFLFGEQEWVVKLPFILMGVGSIYLIFQIGLFLKNQFAAAVSASLMAVSQYFVFYSQIARPYMAGTFFVLLAVFFWYKSSQKEKTDWRNLIGWMLSAASACYTHHFALLLVGLVGLTGFALFRVKLKSYFLSCLGIFLLYLPHLPIFFVQLGKGGVGEWLAKPSSRFLLEFSAYFLQYSWIFSLAIIISVAVSFASKSKKSKWFWPGFLWFALTYLIGHIYSLLVDSVMQFSVLIFSFPLFLLSIFSLFPSGNFKSNLLISLALMLSGTYALTLERKHYNIFYESPYEYLLKDIFFYQDSIELGEPALTDEHRKIFCYYANRYEIGKSSIIFWDDFTDFAELKRYLSSKKEDYFLLGVMYQHPRELPLLVQEYFPYRILHKRYYQGDFYLFSRNLSLNKGLNEAYFKSSPIDKKTNTEWNKAKSDFGDWITIGENQEYVLGLNVLGIDSLYRHRHDIITYKAKLHFGLKPKEAAICSALYRGDSIINFQTSFFSDYSGNIDSGVTNIYHSFTLPNKLLKHDELTLKIFLWNLDQQAFAIKNQEFIIEKGNPKLYALYENLN